MTVESWLGWAVAEARSRGLESLVPLLESLAASTAALRRADWNDEARGDSQADGQ